MPAPCHQDFLDVGAPLDCSFCVLLERVAFVRCENHLDLVAGQVNVGPLQKQALGLVPIDYRLGWTSSMRKRTKFPTFSVEIRKRTSRTPPGVTMS